MTEEMVLELEERCRKVVGDALGQHLNSQPHRPDRRTGDLEAAAEDELLDRRTLQRAEVA